MNKNCYQIRFFTLRKFVPGVHSQSDLPVTLKDLMQFIMITKLCLKSLLFFFQSQIGAGKSQPYTRTHTHIYISYSYTAIFFALKQFCLWYCSNIYWKSCLYLLFLKKNSNPRIKTQFTVLSIFRDFSVGRRDGPIPNGNMRFTWGTQFVKTVLTEGLCDWAAGPRSAKMLCLSPGGEKKSR